MGERTGIQWCDATFNPWMGCAAVSPGCANCYAELMVDKRQGRAKWGPNGTRTLTSDKYWRDPLIWNRKAAAEGRPWKVFCASLSDLFEDRPDLVEPRKRVFDLIGQTPNLIWLLLTKRPQNILPMIPNAWQAGPRAVPNVRFGFSAEDQKRFEERWQAMKYVTRKGFPIFLSAEPLLGPLNLDPWDGADNFLALGQRTWVIVGGESGSNARQMDPEWPRAIRDQSVDAGVPFFFKQWGEWAWHYFTHPADKAGWYPTKVGKKAAGRLLDGREWSEFPEQLEKPL